MSTWSSTSSSNNQAYDPTALPPRWLDCPRKSEIIAGKFVAFKTPLDSQYKDKIDIRQRWTCKVLIDSFKSEQKKLGLVIDLTNTDRFYNSNVEFIEKQIRYEKIRCRGHGERPGDEQINKFIQICNEFSNTNPNDIIGVHCTHGFNRTGFLICAYLCRELDMSIDATINIFAKARSPGIYKQDYLDELIRRYGDDSTTGIQAPVRPEWCQTGSDDEDEPNEKPVANGGIKRSKNNSFNHSNKRVHGEQSFSIPQFAVTVPGVTAICVQPAMTNLQLKCQRMCEWNRSDFPGSQPVSMDITNYGIITQAPYMVSWKADGTRYMMLIEDENKIYMFDRDNSVFQINHLVFPKDSDFTSHLKNTLVDGELVVDNVNGAKVPRYLIYDIVVYENENVGKKPFPERFDMIRHLIISMRSQATEKGRIDKTLEPFSIRSKDFWDLAMVHKLVGPKFQSQIAHGVDGLIFQPVTDPYTPGRTANVLKWKDDNTVDFLLKISTERPKMGQLAEKKAYLFVNGLKDPFSQIPLTRQLCQYNNKIIECSYHDKQWHFQRERTDKSFPNGKEAAFGAIRAIQQPITKEILCSMIDEFLKHKTH